MSETKTTSRRPPSSNLRTTIAALLGVKGSRLADASHEDLGVFIDENAHEGFLSERGVCLLIAAESDFTAPA